MVTKDHRRELRLSSSDDDLITEAAGLLGLSVSEFLLGRAVTDAEAIVDAHRTVRLQQESFDQFLAALDGPAKPIPELVDQIRKSRALKHVD
ncbi:MAG: type II toxin-antitoxin system TacA family antitoxin [Mycobacteriales bacterium]